MAFNFEFRGRGSTVIRVLNSETESAFVINLIEHARRAGDPWALSWSETVLRDELTKARTLIATRDKGPLGFLCLREPGPLWEITLVAVAESARRQGVAEDLIQASLNWVGTDVGHAALAANIGLEVREDNLAAIRAYEKTGFKQIGRRTAYYRDGADALLYQRSL